MEIAAQELGHYDKYSPGAALIFLRLGYHASVGHKRKVRYVIYANHGSGGGRKEGAKAIRLADMGSIIDADIYIHAHTHMPMIQRQVYLRTCESNSSVKPVDRLFVNTAAMLDYGGYGEEQEYKPSSKKCPIIYLSGTEKRAEALL